MVSLQEAHCPKCYDGYYGKPTYVREGVWEFLEYVCNTCGYSTKEED